MTDTPRDDAADVTALRRRITELEDLLEAIENHRVDASVLGRPEGKRVFMPEGADRPYRALIEDMRQGAVMLNESGLVLYCNRRFAGLVDAAPESITGTLLYEWIPLADRPLLRATLDRARGGSAYTEAHLQDGSSGRVPCSFCFTQLPPEAGATFGVIVTDLSEKLAYGELAAAEEMARSVLEQAGNAIVVVDRDERIVRGNAAAATLAGTEIAPGTPFGSVFELRPTNGHTFASCIASARSGSVVQGIEFRFQRPEERPRHVLLNVGTLHVGARSVGHIISLTDITERKTLERELRAQAEALKRADRRKDGFLAMLSHQLRSPLASIRNAAELLRQSEPSEATEISCGVIDRQVKHLAGLIEELLDVSLIAHGKVLLRKKSLDLAEVVSLVTADHRAAMVKAGLVFDVAVPAQPVWVLADPTRVTQMLGNLLHNAIKFTDRGGSVRVALDVEGGATAALQVEDTGIGIDPEHVAQVFVPFEQVHPSRGGLGLGLALVKGLAELQGGSAVAATSGSEQGTRFTVRLPIVAPGAKSGEASNGTPSTSVTPTSSRILIIEDHRDSAEMLRLLLQLHGQNVEVANSGEEGLVRIKDFHPDVVLCDLTLEGGISGFEVARRLRAEGSLGSTRLVALSGHGSDDDRARSRALGFDLHMVKPIDFAELQRCLGLEETPPEGKAASRALP